MTHAWGVPDEVLTASEALAVRMAAAERWGTVPAGLVVSQLGYPVVPEGQGRQAGPGRWIPATVSREVIGHPAWWLEDSARLRWAEEDDDDYAGRVNWDLRARGVSDGDGVVVDVLWKLARIDVHLEEGWERVRRWLVGGEDMELSGLRVPRGPVGPEGAAEKAQWCRPELEERLRARVVEELHDIAERAADAADRFRGTTPEGVCGPLLAAVKGGDREAAVLGVNEVQKSLAAAQGFLKVLTDTLQETVPPGPCHERIGALLVGYLRDGGRRSGRALTDECLSQVRAVCVAGLGAADRLAAGQFARPERPAGLIVDHVYGPPTHLEVS